MALAQLVQEVFAYQGLLHNSSESFRPREGQTQMAAAIAERIEAGGALVVEAGTGVGKTFAYLVPALLSGKRVMISTATKTLQDQLFDRDLPGLTRLLGLPVRMALLKGRGSYVCVHRLERAMQGAPGSDPRQSVALSKITLWAQRTRTGDLAELSALDENSGLVPVITSTRDNCLGASCPKASDCHVNLARREAMNADVVVVNHHLFFADLNVRESGMAELLPSAQVMVFDEAHQLNDIGVQFLGRQLSTSQLWELARDVLACGHQWARGAANWPDLSSELDHAIDHLRTVFQPSSKGLGSKFGTASRVSWTGVAPEGVAPGLWCSALEQLLHQLKTLHQAIQAFLEIAPDFVRLHERLEQSIDNVQLFINPAPTEKVRWVDVGPQVRLIESPLDVAQVFQDHLLKDPESPRTLIFTSATLGDDDALTWFTVPCGLQHAQVLRVPSPFDYSVQSKLYVPLDLPAPSDPTHAQQLALKVLAWARILKGRTLVLTTTLRAVQQIAQVLRQHTSALDGLEVLAQGTGSRNELLQRFRGEPFEHVPQVTLGRILVASASFWEGVDIPGKALQLVVIDKLPFPPPSDPLVRARSQRLEADGRNAFQHYFLPEATVALKQGAGRLIRSISDRGALVIGDVRLQNMSYGRRMLKALEPMQTVRKSQELETWLEELASSD